MTRVDGLLAEIGEFSSTLPKLPPANDPASRSSCKKASSGNISRYVALLPDKPKLSLG